VVVVRGERRIPDGTRHPVVRPALRAGLALLVAVPVAFTVGFLFSPDPTGLVPVLLALVLTVVFAAAIYRVVPTTSESTAD
jgi:hypothetical protein